MGDLRKRPAVVEAVQYHDWMRAADALPNGVFVVPMDGDDVPVCHALGESLRVFDGDWIVAGANGEFYPVKPDIFNVFHEEVSDLLGRLDEATAIAEKALENFDFPPAEEDGAEYFALQDRLNRIRNRPTN